MISKIWKKYNLKNLWDDLMILGSVICLIDN